MKAPTPDRTRLRTILKDEGLHKTGAAKSPFDKTVDKFLSLVLAGLCQKATLGSSDGGKTLIVWVTDPHWFDEVYDAISQNGVKQGYRLSGYDLTDPETGEDIDPMDLDGVSEINERFMVKANQDFSRKIAKFFGVSASSIENTEWYDGPTRVGIFEFPGRLLWAELP